MLETVIFRGQRFATNHALPISFVAQLRLALSRNGQVAELINDFPGHRAQAGYSDQPKNKSISGCCSALPSRGALAKGFICGGTSRRPLKIAQPFMAG